MASNRQVVPQLEVFWQYLPAPLYCWSHETGSHMEWRHKNVLQYYWKAGQNICQAVSCVQQTKSMDFTIQGSPEAHQKRPVPGLLPGRFHWVLPQEACKRCLWANHEMVACVEGSFQRAEHQILLHLNLAKYLVYLATQISFTPTVARSSQPKHS